MGAPAPAATAAPDAPVAVGPPGRDWPVLPKGFVLAGQYQIQVWGGRSLAGTLWAQPPAEWSLTAHGLASFRTFHACMRACMHPHAEPPVTRRLRRSLQGSRPAEPAQAQGKRPMQWVGAGLRSGSTLRSCSSSGGRHSAAWPHVWPPARGCHQTVPSSVTPLLHDTMNLLEHACGPCTSIPCAAGAHAGGSPRSAPLSSNHLSSPSAKAASSTASPALAPP